LNIPSNINLKNVKAVIWDWNGTLLDDLLISITSMNQMLDKRNYPLLNTEKYKEIFTFPVKDYYVKAGVNFEEHQWDDVAMEFINNYRKNVAQAEVHPTAVDVLAYLSHRNYRQFILSAMQQEFLSETIRTRIDLDFFEEIVGLNNHYAHTKLENARQLVRKTGLEKNELLMIGDTLHDFEVSQAAGIFCILFSGGHQSRKILQQSGTLIIDDLLDIKKLL